jgi:accessory gene regulator protein AgrB
LHPERGHKQDIMAQLKRHSFLESVANVAVGYGVALLSQIIIFPLFGIQVSLKDNLMIGVFFTVISIIRSYVLRRIFNRVTG